MGRVYTHWNDFPERDWRWPSFSPEELASNRFIKGKSGPVEKAELMIDERSMDMLQALRDRLGKPLIVNSAFRTQTYNAQIGGAANGYHPKAMAFDISMANHDPSEFEAAAVAAGFRGVGHYPASNFMHIDTRPGAQVVRFKGTGKNNAWFPENAGTFTASEPRPETIVEQVKKYALPGAGGVAIGVAPAIAQGSGPVQYAIAAVLVIGVVAVIGFLFVRHRRPTVDV